MVSYWFLHIIHLTHSVIAVVQLIVFIYQLSPCWAMTVKTQVTVKISTPSYRAPIPPAHNVPWYCNTGPVLVKRNSLSNDKRNRRSSNRYVNEAIVPAGSLGIQRTVLESTFSYLWKTALTYHTTFLAHSAKQTKQTNIPYDDAFPTHARFAFGPGKANANTSSVIGKVTF